MAFSVVASKGRISKRARLRDTDAGELDQGVGVP